MEFAPITAATHSNTKMDSV